MGPENPEQPKHPVLNKTRSELFWEIMSTDSVSPHTLRAQTALQDMMVGDIIKALDRNSTSATKLARVLNWLYVVIALAAVVELLIHIFLPSR